MKRYKYHDNGDCNHGGSLVILQIIVFWKVLNFVFTTFDFLMLPQI